MSLGIRTGGLSTQSFSWLAKKHHLTEEEVRDLDSRYKKSDLDRSGQLDKDELRVLLKATIAKSASEAGLNKFLTSQWHNVDRDGNGTVDFDEFLNLYAVLKNSEIFAAKPKAAGQPVEVQTQSAVTTVTTTGAKAAAVPAAKGKGKGKEKAKTASGANLGVQKKQRTKTKRAKKPVFQPSAELTRQNYVTNEIVWSCIRNHNSFLIKRGNGRNVLSSERGNLRNIHSKFTSGLIRDRPVDVSILEGGALNLRTAAPSERRRNQPVRRNVNVKLAGSNRKLARQLRKQLANNRGAQTGALARMSRLRASAPGAHQPKTRKNRRGNPRNVGIAAQPKAAKAAASAATTQPAAQTAAPTTTAQ